MISSRRFDLYTLLGFIAVTAMVVSIDSALRAQKSLANAEKSLRAVKEGGTPTAVFHRARVDGRGDDTGIIVTVKSKRLEGEDLDKFVQWFNDGDDEEAIKVREAVGLKIKKILEECAPSAR